MDGANVSNTIQILVPESEHVGGQDEENIHMLNIQDVLPDSPDDRPNGPDDILTCQKVMSRIAGILKRLLTALVFVGFYAYVGFCLYLNPEMSVLVCTIALMVGVWILDKVSKRRLRTGVFTVWDQLWNRVKMDRTRSMMLKRGATVVILACIVAFLVYDIQGQWNRYIPLIGLTLIILTSVMFSNDFRKINWTSVIWGLILQFVLGLIILRWRVGFVACAWFGKQITIFLTYADAGSKLVFGMNYTDHPLAFQVCPVIVFFSAVVQVLYYLGVMQLVIKAIASVLQAALGTTPIESFATAAHIFISMSESSMILRPFLKKLTTSEIHALMTSGYATVAGSIIAAFISFGVPAEHLINASFMSAPAALAIAKISMPEISKSKIKSQADIKIPSKSEANMIEALSVGATNSIKLVAYIVVNLIAFQAILAFLDASMVYFGSIVGYPELNFQMICAYLFMPVAVIIGVPWAECYQVGAWVGKKIIINIFLAYADLGNAITTGAISGYTATVATYCLCGFSGIVSIGLLYKDTDSTHGLLMEGNNTLLQVVNTTDTFNV